MSAARAKGRSQPPAIGGAAPCSTSQSTTSSVAAVAAAAGFDSSGRPFLKQPPNPGRLRTARRLADHEPDLGAHRDGAELLVERAAAAERHVVDRDQLVTHGNAAAALGLPILGDRQHLVLAVDGEPETDRSAHELHRRRPAAAAAAAASAAAGATCFRSRGRGSGCLAGGGWPNAGLVDFILPHAGIGELRLLLPALTTLAENRWLAWINPPFTPYAPALEAAGIDSSKILLIYAKSHKEMLWAMERTCKSGSCGAVLVWPDERKLSLKETRRVQLAAKQGTTLSVLFRPIEATSKASLAELRLGLSPGKDPLHLSVDIIKRRGGWPVKGLTLPIAAVTQSQYTSANAVRQKLSLWREQRAGVQFQQEALQETLKEQGDNNDFTKMGSEDSSKNSSKNYVKSYAEGFSEGNTGNTSAPSLH